MQFFFFAKCTRAYDSWKQCQRIIRTLKETQNLGGKLVIFETLFKSLPCFNVLETCRVYLLTIDLRIFQFIKKFIELFLENAKFVGVDQITCKNCNKSSWMHVNKILLTHNRPEQFPSFFSTQFSMESNHYEMKPHFQSLSFSLKIS